MPIDTALKRRSVHGYTAPAVMLPTASGSVGQADRVMLVWLYAEVFTPIVPPVPSDPVFAVGRDIVHTAAPRAFALPTTDREGLNVMAGRTIEHTVSPRDKVIPS